MGRVMTAFGWKSLGAWICACVAAVVIGRAVAQQSPVQNPPASAPSPSFTLARSQSQPSNPAGTASASVVMAGLAGTITPGQTGNVLFLASMSASNSTINDGCTTRIRFGTGTAPVNGAASTGTTAGNAIGIQSAVATDTVGITNTGYATGLIPQTPYWIDIGFTASSGGTCSLTGITLIAIEL